MLEKLDVFILLLLNPQRQLDLLLVRKLLQELIGFDDILTKVVSH